jgi:hypothetical protein
MNEELSELRSKYLNYCIENNLFNLNRNKIFEILNLLKSENQNVFRFIEYYFKLEYQKYYDVSYYYTEVSDFIDYLILMDVSGNYLLHRSIQLVNDLENKLAEQEEALRSLAFSLGVGGYNSLEFDAKEYQKKIEDGIDNIVANLKFVESIDRIFDKQ